MHASRLPRLLPLALAFLLSPPAFAADTPAAELLRQAEAERPAYLDTLRQLVAVDSGTGQAEGLGQLSALLAERLQALGAQVRSAPARRPRPATTWWPPSMAPAASASC